MSGIWSWKLFCLPLMLQPHGGHYIMGVIISEIGMMSMIGRNNSSIMMKMHLERESEGWISVTVETQNRVTAVDITIK